MSASKIVGLKADYGSLDLSTESRAAFIADAERVLHGVGEALRAQGLIREDFTVRHQPSSIPGYVGEIAGFYQEPQRRFGVNLVYSHTPQQVHTRPDGVGGYALYRRMLANRADRYDSTVRPEDRRSLYGSYPDALIHLVQTMLADHPSNPDAPRKPATASE